MGVGNDLVLVSGSILAWCLCNDVRQQIEMGVLTDRFVGYVALFREDHYSVQR